MSDDKFRACLAETLKWEGGWSNHPADPGGPTMKGVIQRVYDAWREKNGLPRRSVRLIEDHEVEAIYRENYWNIVRGDELPPGVDLAVFDFGVNSGPARAARYLQKVLKVKIDGVIGPVTLKAANDADPLETIRALMAERRAFLNQIPYKQHFIKGWMRRCDGIEQACVRMCGLPIKEAPVAPIADADAQSETQAKADHDPREGLSPATVAATGTVAGAAASQVVPAPPPEITETVTQLSVWQTLIASAQTIAMFAVEHWPWVLLGIGTFAGLTWWNRRAQQ
jgi:Putative secretion activating protein